MAEFEDTFRRAVADVLAENPAIRHEWLSDPLSLRIHGCSESGFEVKLVARATVFTPTLGIGMVPLGMLAFGPRKTSLHKSKSS